MPNPSRRPSTALLLTLAALVSNLHFYLPVFVFYIQQRGLTLSQINTLQLVPLITIALFEVPTGIFGDRFGRRRSVALGLACVGFSEAGMLIAHAFWQFVLLQLVLGIGFAFISGSMTALLVDSIPSNEARDTNIKRALGRLSAATSVGGVLSFALASALFQDTQEWRYFWPIVATAGAWFASAALVAFVRESRTAVHAATARGTSLSLLRSGWRNLRHNAALRRIVALSVLSNPLGFYWIAIYQPVLARSNVPLAWFGLALAAGSLLAAMVEANAERIERFLPPRSGLQLLLLLPAALYVALALPHAPIVAVGLFVLHKGILYAASPLLDTYTNAELNPESRATALSMISLLGTAYQAAIGLPLGALVERSLSAWCLAVAAIIAVSVVVLPMRKSDS